MELDRYNGSQLDRKARKQIAEAERAADIARVEIDVREGVAAHEVRSRIVNGAMLTMQTKALLNQSDSFTEHTARNPRQEARHNSLDDTLTMASGILIEAYMLRPRRYE